MKHKEIGLKVAREYLDEIRPLPPKFEIFGDAARPLAHAVGELEQSLKIFIFACEQEPVSERAFDHLAKFPLIRDALWETFETGSPLTLSMYDLPRFFNERWRERDEQQRRIVEEIRAKEAQTKLEASAKAAREAQEQKRKRLAEELGIDLNALPRTGA